MHQKPAVQFVIDASGHPLPFRYHLDGQPTTLPAGGRVEHTSDLPPRLDFDTGDGSDHVSTKIMVPGRFIVGVDPESSRLDRFLADEAEAAGPAVDTAARVEALWRDSAVAVLRPASNDASSDPVDQAIGTLLDAIE